MSIVPQTHIYLNQQTPDVSQAKASSRVGQLTSSSQKKKRRPYNSSSKQQQLISSIKQNKSNSRQNSPTSTEFFTERKQDKHPLVFDSLDKTMNKLGRLEVDLFSEGRRSLQQQPSFRKSNTTPAMDKTLWCSSHQYCRSPKKGSADQCEHGSDSGCYYKKHDCLFGKEGCEKGWSIPDCEEDFLKLLEEDYFRLVEEIYNWYGQTAVGNSKIMNYTTYKVFLKDFGMGDVVTKEASDLLFYENANNQKIMSLLQFYRLHCLLAQRTFPWEQNLYLACSYMLRKVVRPIFEAKRKNHKKGDPELRKQQKKEQYLTKKPAGRHQNGSWR